MRNLFPIFVFFYFLISFSFAAEYVPRELLVKLHKNEPANIFLSLDGTIQYGPIDFIPGLYKVLFATEQAKQNALNNLKLSSNVEYAEENVIFSTAGIDEGPEFDQQWAYKKLELKSLWEKGVIGSRKIVVGVIDTGIDWQHPDLVDNLYSNPIEVADNQIDDDKNGYIDDVHGWNFIKDSSQSQDDNKHGTHVAGIIGATGGNKIGVAGVAWEVSLLPLKFLDASGKGSLENAIKAIGYAQKLGVHIINCSWVARVIPPESLREAMAIAARSGVFFVVAAGNEKLNIDKFPVTPASIKLDNIIVVAATDEHDNLAEFSNYGTESVHVASPGVDIMSTLPNRKFGSLSGTSMATPHISGLAALMLAENPQLTPLEMKHLLIKSSSRVPKLRKKIIARGRANGHNAVHSIFPENSDPEESDWISQFTIIESDHPYRYNENRTFNIKIPGAKAVRVHFNKYQVEVVHDAISVETTNGDILDMIEGESLNYISNYGDGDSLVIRLTSDMMTNRWGFLIDRIDYIKE